MEKDLVLNEVVETGVEVTGGLNLAKVGKIGLAIAGGVLLIVVVPKAVKKLRARLANGKNLVEETPEITE